MRKDQIEYFKPVCQMMTDKIFVSLFGDFGVKKTSDVIPNTDEFLEGMVKSMYEEYFTEQEVDKVISFNKKFYEKNLLASAKSEEFVSNYFKENEKVIQAMLEKFQGE